MPFSFNFVSLSAADPHAPSENVILVYLFFEESETNRDFYLQYPPKWDTQDVTTVLTFHSQRLLQFLHLPEAFS